MEIEKAKLRQLRSVFLNMIECLDSRKREVFRERYIYMSDLLEYNSYYDNGGKKNFFGAFDKTREESYQIAKGKAKKVLDCNREIDKIWVDLSLCGEMVEKIEEEIFNGDLSKCKNPIGKPQVIPVSDFYYSEEKALFNKYGYSDENITYTLKKLYYKFDMD